MIYLLYGEETYLKENKVKKIKKEFGELIQGINFVSIDETNVSNIISDIETPAFGYEKKLIIAKNTNLFKKEKKTAKNPLSEKIEEYIEKYHEQISESVDIVFIEDDIEENELFKTIKKYGEVIEFNGLKLPDLIKNIKNICGLYKVKIDDQTAKYLVECCGTDMQDIINEIRKLIEYVGEGNTITIKDIDLLSTKQIQAIIFDLTDNLGKKNITKSLEVLKGLIISKEPAQKILVTLYNHFKKLFIIKIAEENNKDIATAMKLKPNQLFLVTKYKQQSRFFDKNELENIIKELSELDKKYKTGLLDLEIGLEAILCNYCSK